MISLCIPVRTEFKNLSPAIDRLIGAVIGCVGESKFLGDTITVPFRLNGRADLSICHICPHKTDATPANSTYRSSETTSGTKGSRAA